MAGRRLPPLPGAYAVLLRCWDADAVAIGRLGVLRLRPGYYVYVGSARGPGGIRARLGRHLAGSTRRRWHVDSLRARLEVAEAWFALAGEGAGECLWARALGGMRGAVEPAAGFGASDCACRTHLLYFRSPPSLRSFGRRLARLSGAAARPRLRRLGASAGSRGGAG